MSFINPNAFYQEELLLLDKNLDAPTTITDGQVVNGDLAPFRHRIELVNTGNQKQNNGILILRIPPDGTFIRTEPILIDETAKDDYIIQVQLKQDRDKDGVYEEEGKLHRFIVGQPTIQEDEHGGETLKLNLIPLEYKVKETVDSERLTATDSERTPFRTPKQAFIRRAIAYNEIKGIDNPQLLFTTGVGGSIDLPDKDSLKQEWRPPAPTPTHDLFREIIERQSLPGVGGGVFTDFFFDYDPHPLSTKTINLKAEAVGTTDRGIIIDPLTFDPADSEKDKTINVDLIKFKNNVILECSPRGGSLPMDKARFASQKEHGRFRSQWDPTITYIVDENDQIQVGDPVLGTRYFTALFDNTNNDPLGVGQTTWFEDFVLIPQFNQFTEYKEGQIVTTVDGSFYRFWKANKLIPKGGFGPFPASLDWDDLATKDIAINQRAEFFSYTPWTADFGAMRASLFGVRPGSATETALTNIGYSAVVPDFNYIRANFDRVQADSRFEQVTFKDVTRFVNNSNVITVGERHLGARFLINGVGAGLFAGHNNQIAEWIGADFPSGSMTINDWAFSNSPVDGDMILDQDTARIYTFNASLNVWEIEWDIITNNISFPDRLQGDGRLSSPLHICRELKLVEGSSGIPGQAFELVYDWLPSLNEGDDRNFNSIGAWFFMQFPFPKIETFGRDIGDIYKNPVLDTSNLTYDSKGQNGWNNGLDSEDLGRIQRLNMKLRLTLSATDFLNLTTTLAVGYADMPMKAFAVDIFDRVWFTDFKLRRNGEYSSIKLGFGETAPQQLHHYRVDELLQLFGILLPFDFFLKQKEWTGIEFDWRFVKSWGVFYSVGYGVNDQYIAGQIPDYITNIIGQSGSQLLYQALSLNPFDTSPKNAIIKTAKLAIDELNFEKQLYVNSDDVQITDARTELEHFISETDYLNAKSRAQAFRERKKFVNQAWFMKAHGDVRARFGEKFIASGPRVPGGTQELVFNEVKHIIDSDGYFLEFTGVRKFVFI